MSRLALELKGTWLTSTRNMRATGSLDRLQREYKGARMMHSNTTR